MHDIGKVVYRANGQTAHPLAGLEFLSKIKSMQDQKEVLNCVRYHHEKNLITASLPDNSLAYIVWIADNISSGMDVREVEGEEGTQARFIKTAPLQSVFNILNGNQEKLVYPPSTLKKDQELPYPDKQVQEYSAGFYEGILQSLQSGLHEISLDDSAINSLLQLLEVYLSYIPSSTNQSETRDISLFDHSKTTAAIAACIEAYLNEKQITDYKGELLVNKEQFYKEEVFQLFSMDLSGIQSFIYTISGEAAKKNLRARSFYLEILMESIMDEFLEALSLSRVNCLYNGGGHAYLLLPNTKKAKDTVKAMMGELRHWLLQEFQIDLYLAHASVSCNGNQLMDKPNGSYSELYKKLSENISREKLSRYTADEILQLNARSNTEHERECKECKRTEGLNKDDLCPLCASLLAASTKLTDSNCIVILKNTNKGLPLFEGKSAMFVSEKEVPDYQKNNPEFVRVYTLNNLDTGPKGAVHLWAGTYASSNDFHILAKASAGIERLGVLRADVDNLGLAFIKGFQPGQATLSRMSVFSRHLSLFFKYQINTILKAPGYQFSDSDQQKRNAAIVYSGGDDLFIIGSWNEMIEAAIDIHDAFERYTQSTLHLSAGIGMYTDSYPVSRMAEETGDLENQAKHFRSEKNALALFDKDDQDLVYDWQIFCEEVIGEKYEMIETFFMEMPQKGNTFLYKILELLRDDNSINLARLAYLLARVQKENKAQDDVFIKSVYRWALNEKQRRQFITAAMLYIYANRERSE